MITQKVKSQRSFSDLPRFANHIPTYELKLDTPPAPVEIQSMPLAYVLGTIYYDGVGVCITAVFTILNADGDILANRANIGNVLFHADHDSSLANPNKEI